MAKRLQGLAVPNGVLVVGAGRFAVALRRPTGEIVVHRRAWNWPGAPSGWRGGRIVAGLSAWCERACLLLRALVFSLQQQTEGTDLAPARIGQAIGSDLRPPWWLRLRLGAALLTGAAALAVLPTGVHRLTRLLQAPPGAARRLALLQAGVWALGTGVVWLAMRLTEVATWRQHHAALHQVLAALQHDLPLKLHVVAKVDGQRHACAGQGLAWFLLVLGALGPSLSRHDRWALPGAFALLLVLGLCGDLATDRDRAQARGGWAAALAWPGRWLQAFSMQVPDTRALEVALVAARAAVDGDDSLADQATPGPLSPYPSLADACARENNTVSC